jgi:MOSC domain-containing protein YiiM
MKPSVLSVGASPTHSFSKPALPSITLLVGFGVAGDAHCGETVKHRSRVAQDPSQPNLRQVHLIHVELFRELAGQGFDISPGDLGENITTHGVDLLVLPRDTVLRIGPTAVVRVTGLRNPCGQLDAFRKGLMSAVLDRSADGKLIRKSGVMGVVIAGGEVRPGDDVVVELPPEPYLPLERV